MTVWRRLLPAGEVPPGEGRVVAVDGREFAVLNDGKAFHVLDNACPHQGGPLGEGRVENPTVICPWHGWEFNLQSGACVFNDAIRVGTYPVKVEDGYVCAGLPE